MLVACDDVDPVAFVFASPNDKYYIIFASKKKKKISKKSFVD